MDVELRKEVAEVVIKVISEELSLPAEAIDEEMKLIEDLDMDSLDIVSVGSTLEDKYKIEISDEELYNIVTVGNVIDEILKAISIKKFG
ncbi:acyl carrier protein [bacterium]|nr:acyl carrier protein [bacterium]